MSVVRRVIPLLVMLAVLASACAGGSDSALAPEGGQADDAPSSEPAELAPDFTVTTFEGAGFTLSEQGGTPVVLNFWESW